MKGCVTMPMPKEITYTIEDIYNLPDGQRAELIDGVIYDLAPPSRIHQKISTRLASIKNAQYALARVREYWIVDPARERTTIYHYEEDAAPMIVPFDQPVQSGIYKDLQITINDLLK